ncbi:MAG: hypothetical protein II936_01215 [Oscillospiraceae bacterium]|nr:hypothetical protein [Oscillospiraceae bacterium]
MEIRIGADIGGTSVKLVCTDNNDNILAKTVYTKDNSSERLAAELEKIKHIAGADTDTVYCTGVGGGLILALKDRYTPVFVSEFESFGRGARILSGMDDIIAVSMGTGTAFVRVQGDEYTHLGGSGIGGGTFGGLGERFLGVNDIHVLDTMSENGDTSKVDLTVGDISAGDVSGIDPKLTASNFGKPRCECSDDDIAAGIANMIYQCAGVMAALACKGTDIHTAVFVGAMAGSPFGRKVLMDVSQLHPGIGFIIPENSTFAGAVGSCSVR